MSQHPSTIHQHIHLTIISVHLHTGHEIVSTLSTLEVICSASLATLLLLDTSPWILTSQSNDQAIENTRDGRNDFSSFLTLLVKLLRGRFEDVESSTGDVHCCSVLREARGDS